MPVQDLLRSAGEQPDPSTRDAESTIFFCCRDSDWSALATPPTPRPSAALRPRDGSTSHRSLASVCCGGPAPLVASLQTTSMVVPPWLRFSDVVVPFALLLWLPMTVVSRLADAPERDAVACPR